VWYYYSVSIFEEARTADVEPLSGGGGVPVRAMGPQDLVGVARMHLEHFPDGYYARLGERFLVTHYRGYLESPHAVAYVVDRGGVLQAYLVGTLDGVAHQRHVAQSRRLARAGAGVSALGARPHLWWDFITLRSHRYVRRAMSGLRRTGPADPSQRPFGELAYVITRRSARNRGIGAHLVGSYLGAARTAGCSHACLVTLVDNGVARRFYQKRGWAANGLRRSLDGAALAAYRYDL
jgi:ribosomal protein S18 acetylase RimI-like enzyme